MNILVIAVEDEPIIGDILVRRFEKMGMTVEHYRTWSAFHSRLQRHPSPQIVSLDLILPDCTMSHRSKIAEIRRLVPDSLLLVVSGIAKQAAEDDGPRADAYIDKTEMHNLNCTILDHLRCKKGYEENVKFLEETVRRLNS